MNKDDILRALTPLEKATSPKPRSPRNVSRKVLTNVPPIKRRRYPIATWHDGAVLALTTVENR